jgi:hypothetical protein
MAVIDTGASVAGKANVDANNNLQVNLPVVASRAGFAQQTYVPDSTVTPKTARVTLDNGAYTAEPRQVLELDFNSASTTWAAKIGTNATTMTKAVQNGYMRLNNSAITTTTTGISIYSNRVVTVENGYDLRVKMHIRTNNATATNKQIDAGLGYYAFGAGQAAAMNEFLGFRWTTTGGLLGVMETSQGGAPTAQTVNINSNAPYSDNVAREYEVILTDVDAEFWVEGVFQGRIAKPTGSYGIFKGVSLPLMARIFNSGAASAATTFDVGDASVIKIGCDDGVAHNLRMAAMGKSSYYYQPDLTAAATATHLLPASGTAPTPAVGSNTASAANNVAVMGGLIGNTLTGVTVTLSTNVLWIAYQNPAVPTVAGVATNARNFYVTGIMIGNHIITAALTGGGYTAAWFAAIGATATSLATTDADGTTAVAQKAPRFIPLSLVSTVAAAAALGTVSTDVGDHQFQFPTPLPVHPGEFLHIGFRTIAVTAAVTVGAAQCMISVNGYWD